jgi:hypothetical protein
MVPPLHSGGADMLRTFAISVITVSCSQATHPPGNIDASPVITHDAPLAHDAPESTHDGMIPPIDAPPPCKPPNIIHGDGKHNPGMDCNSSCHSHGFSVSGTLYLADGTTPASDATVTVTDALNNKQDVIVSTNGNFFSFLPVVYPITITASMCPSAQAMVSTATAGNCNSTGCHEPGGVQGTAHL